MAACSSPDQGGDAFVTTTRVATTTTRVETTTTTTISSGDLSNPDVRPVEVEGRPLLVAWADSLDERQRGLMEVEELGDLDGMMFEFESERPVSFTMRNTRIPLDIYFFDSDGEAAGMLEMVPCESEPCPSYPADGPVRYALEVPAGHLVVGSAPELVIP